MDDRNKRGVRWAKAIPPLIPGTRTGDASDVSAPNTPTHGVAPRALIPQEGVGVEETRGGPPSRIPLIRKLFQKHQIVSSINNCNRMPQLCPNKQQPDLCPVCHRGQPSAHKGWLSRASLPPPPLPPGGGSACPLLISSPVSLLRPH